MKVLKKGRRSHSSSVVKNAANALETASKKEREQIASEDAVLSIKKQIVAARAKGMTWSEIATAVQAAGLTVSISTIKKVVGKTEKYIETKQSIKKVDQQKVQAVSVAARVREDVQKKAASAAPVAPTALVVAGGFKVDLTSAADI